MHVHNRLRNLRAGTIGALVTCAALAGASTFAATAGASKSTHVQQHVARPGTATRTFGSGGNASGPLYAFHQEFGSNTNGFCTYAGGCNGVQSNNTYGTIDRVSSGFSNGGAGNYAPATVAYTGSGMGLVDGTGDVNQGQGCPNLTITELCTGPYALFAGGTDPTYPTGGFTVTSDLYLDPASAPVAGNLVDVDVAVNNNTGGFGIDNVITACSAGSGSGFVINFGHGSPGSCAGTPAVTTAGWYRFVFDFTNVSGFAYVTMFVYSDQSSGLTQVATSTPQPVGDATPQPISAWGGPNYFWLPTEDIAGVPLANFALQLGSHPKGYTPTTPIN